MKYVKLFIAVTILLIGCSQNESADKIYVNAKIWTGDTVNPSATVLAIKDNKIIYVGNEIGTLDTSSAEVIDLHGKMMVPGFMDNHTHFLLGGYGLASVQLKEAKTKQDFINTIKAYCIVHPGDAWIQGGDWDHENWGGELPQKEWIDSVTGDHPLFVQRYDGHMAFANSKALSLSKINGTSSVPSGGIMIKNKQGEPTGVFKDEAMPMISKAIPEPTQDQLDEYLARAGQYAIEHGVTQVNDMSIYGGWPELKTYRKAYAANKLPLRIYSFVPLTKWASLDSFVKKNGKGDDILHWGGVKGFVDGSLGSTTAWFYQPYVDDPSTSGLNITDTVLLKQWVLAADKAGLQVAVHAIGDRANDFILSVYDEANKVNGSKDRRFRVEHAQHLTQDAIKRFHELNVIASMHPYHLVDDGNWAAKRLDSARLRGTYAFKRMLNEGVMLTFGSDWTVAPINPLYGIYAAVTRRTGNGLNPNGWFADEKISVEQALSAYTRGNAYGSFLDNKLGVLKVGMYADLVVLNEDLFSIKPETIKDVKVLRTVINGKEVFVSH
jgi:predicted amidohydrolase YtcJ